jgi:uncharacterized delta-60 repeat protein
VQSDNKIVVAGRLLGGANTDAVFVRYNENGSLDTTFGNSGITIVDIGGTNLALDVDIASDGKIVASGLSGSNFAVYRLNSNGTMDTTFDGDGVSLVQVGTGNGRANAFDFQNDGKIVAVGSTASNTGLGVIRLNTNGSLDNTFATGGIFTWDLFATGQETLTDVDVVDSFISEFSIVASMDTRTSTGAGGAIALRSNGTINYKFGAGGYYKNSDLGGAWDGVTRRGEMLFFTTKKQSVSNAILSLNLEPTPSQSNDFDGDGFSDYVIYRPSTGNWFVLRSSDLTLLTYNFGLNGDIPLDGDFDGDGKSDVAIFRPSVGQWWFSRSSDGTAFGVTFGQNGDKPVVGDYDKDGKTDIALWRQSDGNYYVLRSSENFTSFYGFPFGTNGDVPVGTAIYP